MDESQGCILLIGQDQEQDAKSVIPSLYRQSWPVCRVQSPDQAVAWMQEDKPYLIILSGHQQDWSQPTVKRLRDNPKPTATIIVVLTDSDEPSWSSCEDYPELDGVLVEPLSNDVLTMLVESARAKTAL